MENYINELKPEMIPEGIYREIVEEIGVTNFVKLAELVGGTTIYIPKSEAILRPVRDMQIKKEFNGCNHTELAKKYNLSERWIRKVCGEGHLEGQVTMFELLKSE